MLFLIFLLHHCSIASGVCCGPGLYCSGTCGASCTGGSCTTCTAPSGRHCPAGSSAASGEPCPAGSYCTGGTALPVSCATTAPPGQLEASARQGSPAFLEAHVAGDKVHPQSVEQALLLFQTAQYVPYAWRERTAILWVPKALLLALGVELEPTAMFQARALPPRASGAPQASTAQPQLPALRPAQPAASMVRAAQTLSLPARAAPLHLCLHCANAVRGGLYKPPQLTLLRCLHTVPFRCLLPCLLFQCHAVPCWNLQ